MKVTYENLDKIKVRDVYIFDKSWAAQIIKINNETNTVTMIMLYHKHSTYFDKTPFAWEIKLLVDFAGGSNYIIPKKQAKLFKLLFID